jgi:hypothetical protein
MPLIQIGYHLLMHVESNKHWVKSWHYDNLGVQIVEAWDARDDVLATQRLVLFLPEGSISQWFEKNLFWVFSLIVDRVR